LPKAASTFSRMPLSPFPIRATILSFHLVRVNNTPGAPAPEFSETERRRHGGLTLPLRGVPRQASV